MIENGDVFRIDKNDAISFLQTFEDGSVDTIITDPPYCSYGVGSSANKYSANTSKRSRDFECGNDILFDNKDFFSNFMFFKFWAAECLRVLKDESRLFVFCDRYGLAQTICMGQMVGFTYLGFVTWCKTNARPQPTRFRKACEYAVEFCKGTPHVKTRIYPNDWWQGAPVQRDKRVHQTQKPVELIKYLLDFAPENGLVVDPFCGSGSTGVAALESGMRFAGCDLNKESSSALYQAYRNYSLDCNEYVRSTADFYFALEKAGFERLTLNRKRYFKGLKIREDSGAEEDFLQ